MFRPNTFWTSSSTIITLDLAQRPRPDERRTSNFRALMARQHPSGTRISNQGRRNRACLAAAQQASSSSSSSTCQWEGCRKEAVGCGLFGALMGAERIITEAGCQVISYSWIQELLRNAAGDAGSAGWYAVILLLGLLFVDPDVRARPMKVVDALSNAGVLISTLYLMFLAVSIIDFCLQFTGLPTFLSLDVLGWLQTLGLGQQGSVAFQLLALMLTMFMAILLGMGMPAVPAYINVALLLGPVLAGLGIANFTAHMFIFYFAVASAITPPVALAAFAASSITNAEPMRTAFSAVKSGIVMFVIPFVFAFYPELLLIEDAVIDAAASASGSITYLAGYDGSVHAGALALILARLALALYLLSSALSGFDRDRLHKAEVAIRLVLAALLMTRHELVCAAAAIAACGVIALHTIRRPAIT